jgi:ligand-binding sensor domain-containing protein
MKFNIVVVFFTLTSLTSCSGQNNSHVDNKIKNDNLIAIAADTLQELGNNIMLIYQDKKNNYWFGSWEDGLYKYDGKIIIHFTTKNGLPNNRVDEIKEDINGNIYINTSSGIAKFDGENFVTLKVSDLNSDWKIEQNDLWFKNGWNSGFIYRYDGNLLYKLQLPKTKLGEDYILKNPNNPNPYTVYSIYKDSKESIWFGTGALGAFRFNGKSFDWILEKDVAEIYNEPSEPSNGVRSIIEDKEGYFWFNSKFRYKVYDSNYSYKTQDSIFYNREKSIGSLDGKTDGNLIEYLSIAKDNNNELWIATYTAGVWRYDGKNITHYTIKDGSKEITLFSIYKDNIGDLWLGTHESGAYKFNGQTFERFEL